MAEDLKQDNIILKTVVSDGDCKIRKGVKRQFEHCKFQIDGRHFGESQRKKIKRVTCPIVCLQSKQIRFLLPQKQI